MNVAALLGHHWRSHRLTLAVLAGGMGLFEWIIIRVAPEQQQAEALRNFIAFMPPVMTSLFGELLENVTARGILAFGYAHPFPVLLLSLWVVRVSARALAGEIGQGTMDLLAARPVSRASQVWAALIALLAGLAVLAAAAWVGTATGLAARPLEGLAASEFLPLAAMVALLFTAFGTLALAVSSTCRAAGEAISVSVGLLAGSFVLDYLARVWTLIGPLRHLSLFMYFQPQVVLRSGVAPVDVVVLGGVAVLCTAGALLLFGGRDL